MDHRSSVLICIWASTLAMHSAENEPALPTSLIPFEEAVLSSPTIMVCQLIDLGFTEFHGPGVSEYNNAVFEVITQLKGTSSPRVICSFQCVVSPPKFDPVKVPEAGKQYIVAGIPVEGVLEINKLVAATPGNVADVKRLLSLGPSSPRRPARGGFDPLSVPVPRNPNAMPASAFLNIAATEIPMPAVKRKTPVWPWLLGFSALVFIWAGIWKRRT